MRPLSWGPSRTEAPPGSVREFFPAQIRAANDAAMFGAYQVRSFSMAREWRRGAHTLKASALRREEKWGTFKGQEVGVSSETGEKAEISRNSWHMCNFSVSLAPGTNCA